MLLLEVISLFDTLNARLVSNEAPPQPSGLHTSRHTAPASDLLTVESTTLQCLQMAITQDAFLSEVLLYVVHTHEIKLSPFSLALLLTMAHIRRHQEATLAALTRAISDQLAAAGRKFEWLGLKQLIDDAAGVLHDTDIERLLVGTAEQSLKMDAIRPYVTALAIRLIDSDCRKNSSDVARLDKSQPSLAHSLSLSTSCGAYDFILVDTPVLAVAVAAQFKCTASSRTTSSLAWR